MVFSTMKGKIKELKQYKDSSGYPSLRLFKNSKDGKMFKVHKIVAETFIGEKPGAKYQVDHIDGDKQNNSVHNLRWITQKANLLKKYNEDGHKTHFAKPVYQYSINGDFVAEHTSMLDAEKVTGIDQSAISKVTRGLLTQTGGFIWKLK